MYTHNNYWYSKGVFMYVAKYGIYLYSMLYNLRIQMDRLS